MSRRTKGAKRSGGHRKYRQKISMEGAVIAGDSRLDDIVYCYRFPSHPGRVKIGYSSRGLTRVAEQSTAFPEMPELIFVIHDRRAKMIEDAFHQALAGQQSDVMGTEWFDAGWDDFLRVSPILRKSLGVQGRRMFRRRLGIVVLLLISLCLYPPMALTQIAMAQNLPPSEIANTWSHYANLLWHLDVASLKQITGVTLEMVQNHPMPVALKFVPVLFAALPLTLPILFKKKQAF